MAWPWSHTPTAVLDAEQNCRELDHDLLAEIYAEWRAQDPELPFGSITGFDSERYHRVRLGALKLPTDVLAGDVWEKACKQATCDNGGYNAWLCPYGCEPHCVPFNRPA